MIFKNAGLFSGDIMGLEDASGLRSDQPCKRRVSKGDEFNKAAPAQQVPAAPDSWPGAGKQQALAAPEPGAGKKGACPADKPPTPPAGEGAEAGAGKPMPGEGAMCCTAITKPDSSSEEK